MFTVTPAQLASIATVVKFGASADRVTPIIQYGQLVADGDTLTVTATDRYVAVVATYKLATPVDEPETMLVAADQLAAAAKTFTLGTAVTFTAAESGNVSAVFLESENYPGQRFGGLEPGGNYPPVGKLFLTPDVELVDPMAGLCLNMATLGRIATIKLPGERGTAHKSAGWRVWGTPQSEPILGSTRPRKSGPILVTRGDVRILVQPNMIVD